MITNLQAELGTEALLARIDKALKDAGGTGVKPGGSVRDLCQDCVRNNIELTAKCLSPAAVEAGGPND